MKHSDAVNHIRLAISEMGGISVPYTVGKFRAMDSERVIKVGQPGVSDVLACVRGRFLGIEIKVEGDTQRDEQGSFQRAVERAGGLYVLAKFTRTENGVETLRRALDAG